MFTTEEIKKFETLKEAFYYINENNFAKKELHKNLQKCANNKTTKLDLSEQELLSEKPENLSGQISEQELCEIF